MKRMSGNFRRLVERNFTLLAKFRPPKHQRLVECISKSPCKSKRTLVNESTMLDTNPTNLLFRIKRFLSEQGMSRTEFGYLCVQDPAFITKLERGRNPRESTRRK